MAKQEIILVTALALQAASPSSPSQKPVETPPGSVIQANGPIAPWFNNGSEPFYIKETSENELSEILAQTGGVKIKDLRQLPSNLEKAEVSGEAIWAGTTMLRIFPLFHNGPAVTLQDVGYVTSCWRKGVADIDPRANVLNPELVNKVSLNDIQWATNFLGISIESEIGLSYTGEARSQIIGDQATIIFPEAPGVQIPVHVPQDMVALSRFLAAHPEVDYVPMLDLLKNAQIAPSLLSTGRVSEVVYTPSLVMRGILILNGGVYVGIPEANIQDGRKVLPQYAEYNPWVALGLLNSANNVIASQGSRISYAGLPEIPNLTAQIFTPADIPFLPPY